MSRHQLEVYLDKGFDLSDLVAHLPEDRQYPQYPFQKVFQAVFLGTACQFVSLYRIEGQCRDGALARRLKRNGVLCSDWARGRVVAALDGIEICHCLVRF